VRGLTGLEAQFSVFASLPEAARDDLASVLGEIGKRVLAVQQAGAPEKTGKLKAALTIQEAVARLRVRIGYPKLTKGRNGLFYAIIQEYGRRAQEVFVRRLSKPARAEWRSRIRLGAASSRMKPADLARGYIMRVRAMTGKRFVHVEDRVDGIVDDAITGFWDRVLQKAGAE
jgi:hypothetical protein